MNELKSTALITLPRRYKWLFGFTLFCCLINQGVLFYLLFFMETPAPLLAASHSSFQGLPPDLEWSRLEKGEIIVSTQNNGSSISCYFLVEGTADAYFKMLKDHPNLPLIFPDLQKVSIQYEQEALAVVEFQGSYSLFSVTYVLLREFFPNTITWRQLSGPFRSFTGTWKLFERGSKTLIYYQTEVLLSQELLSPKIIQHFLKESLPTMVEKMKQRLSSYQ